jgi:hypothetical protein
VEEYPRNFKRLVEDTSGMTRELFHPESEIEKSINENLEKVKLLARDLRNGKQFPRMQPNHGERVCSPD